MAVDGWPTLWGVPLLPGEKLWLLGLILARITGLVTSAPLFSSLYVPVKFRALLAIGISFLVLPTQWETNLPAVDNLVDAVAIVASQWLVGFGLGLAFAVLLGALQLAGELAARTAGLTLADVFDPLANTEISAIAQLFLWLSTAMFFVTGGHRWLVESILMSFRTVPLSQPISLEQYGSGLLAAVASSFVCAMRLAAPVILLLVGCTLILGFVARTFPQLNILAVGLAANALVTVIGLGLALAGILWAFGEEIHLWQEGILSEFLRQGSP